MQVVLENKALKVTINSFGAELASIRGKATDTEYLWNADAKFWKRTAPVLFPFVGSLKNKEYHYEGKTYSMGQHGFARDMEFAVDVQTATEAWFSLRSSEETKAKFPLEFILKIGYELEGKDLKVIWQVENPDTKTLYFSIGGHPAFMCPVDGKGKQSVTSVGPMDPKRILEIEDLTRNVKAGKIFVTAFLDFKTYKKFAEDLAWETEVWIAEMPEHMIHLNGDKFMGPR